MNKKEWKKLQHQLAKNGYIDKEDIQLVAQIEAQDKMFKMLAASLVITMLAFLILLIMNAFQGTRLAVAKAEIASLQELSVETAARLNIASEKIESLIKDSKTALRQTQFLGRKLREALTEITALKLEICELKNKVDDRKN